MITLKIKYKIKKEDEASFHLDLYERRKTQSSAYRYAYNRLKDVVSQKDIYHLIKDKFNLPTWFNRSAIVRANGQYKADKTNKVIKKIFGGKKNFTRRCKNYITNKEWKDKRLEDLYSVGHSGTSGNYKFGFTNDYIIYKPEFGVKIKLYLPYLHKKRQLQYDKIIQLTKERKMPVTVSLNNNYIMLSVKQDLINTKSKPTIKGRYLGIDLNPNYIGVSFYKENKKLITTKLYNLNNLTGKHCNPNKLKHEVREIATQIGRLACHYQIEYLFVEDLKFLQGNKKKGKNYNRLTSNQWLINEFNRMLSKYGKLIKVNCAYSTTIGNVVNSKYPDPIAASMEIARRGIECRIQKGGGSFYPPMLPSSVLLSRWKDLEEKNIGTWIELHNWLRSSGMIYRVPIPNIGMFSLFSSSIKSQVLVF